MESQSSRAVAKNSCETGWMPPSPWTGSMQMAQISFENFARRSATSLKRTNSTPGITGSKGSRYFSLWVVATEPMVRPWKLCSRARNFVPMLRP